MLSIHNADRKMPDVGEKWDHVVLHEVRVVWDEQNLDFLEASKTPKQKINEPKTPYHAPEAEDGLVSPSPTDECAPMVDAVHAEAIRHALSEVASTSGAGCSRPRGGGWTSSEDEAEDMDHDNEGACGRLFASGPPGGLYQLGSAAASIVELIANCIHGLESNGRRWSFEEQRRLHYDEYRKAKMLSGHEMSDEEPEMGAEDGERHLSGGSCSRQTHQDHESNLSRSLSSIDLQAAEM